MSNQPSIDDVARYIFEKMGKPFISQIALYKLLWFCQGWHYAATGTPLFKERFEAWDHGPVPRELWNKFRGKSQLVDADFRGNPDNISKKSKGVIDKVLHHYGEFSPSILRELSHRCEPWRDNYYKSNQIIPNTEIKEYFCSLV